MDIESEFGISKLGFLPERCIERLPDKHFFRSLENIAENLPHLNRSSTLEAEIENIPGFPQNAINDLSEGEQRRLYVILAMVIHSLLHGSKANWHLLSMDRENDDSVASSEISNDMNSDDSPSNYEVPMVLARPFVEVCILLGIPPVITAAATDLWNWKLKDESKPISFSNITCITTMTGTSTEMNFHITPCVMHFYAAPLIMQIFDAPELICNHNEYGLKRLIDDISQMIEKCREVFSRVAEHVDPAIFYHVQRPLLSGFYPDEIMFEGTEDIERPPDWITSPKGPSAGQSTMFVLLDMLLGINHSPIASEFQTEMLLYMPRQHREMVIQFKKKLTMTVKDFLKEQSLQTQNNIHEGLVDSYNNCISQISRLRKLHLNVATKYLSVTTLGTGTSTFRKLLKACIDDTNKSMIKVLHP